MKKMISFVLLVGIVAIFGVLSFEVMSGFILPLFLALLLVVIFRPLHLRLVKLLKGRERTAAGLTTLSILLIVLLPMLWVVTRAATETISLLRELNREEFRNDVVARVQSLRQDLGLELPPDDIQKPLEDIHAALQNLGEPLPPKTDWLSKREVDERRLGQSMLEEWSALLEERLAAGAKSAPPNESASAAAHRETTLASFREFRARLAEMKKSEESQAEFDAAADRAEVALKAFHRHLYGDPAIEYIKRHASFDAPLLQNFQERLRNLAGPLALGTTTRVGSFLFDSLVTFSIMMIAVYYFLADGPSMVAALMRLSPLDESYEHQLLDEFGGLTRAIILATLLSAVVQGLLAGIGYFFAGFESVFLLTLVTMLFAMVPFVGATIVWLPACIWLLIHNQWQAAIGLAVYCAVFVSMADNLIKPWVLHGRSNLHPLLALLSVIGGTQALGPIGIIVGPMVLAFLHTVLVMLQKEVAAMDAKEGASGQGPGARGLGTAIGGQGTQVVATNSGEPQSLPGTT